MNKKRKLSIALTLACALIAGSLFAFSNQKVVKADTLNSTSSAIWYGNDGLPW